MQFNCNSHYRPFIECNALHYNYIMRTNEPLQISFPNFENVIRYNYITITITPGMPIIWAIPMGCCTYCIC